MGDENPNAQVEANLLEGKNRYASAGTTLQDIKNDLDSTAAGLQSSWLGDASQDFQDKRGQLTTTVQSASDVLQKGSISIGKMHDSYIEADEKQKAMKQVNDVLEKVLGVFMLFTAALGVVGAFLELADVAFAAEIGALEAVVEVGEVTTDVTADVGIGEVDTFSSLDNLSDIDPLIDNPVPVDNPPTIPPEEVPAAPPEDAPAAPPEDVPVKDPQDAPVKDPQDTPADPPEDTPVEDPQTDEAPPNVDQPSEAPAESENVEPSQTDEASPNVDQPSEAPAESENVDPPQTDEASPNVDEPSEEPTPEPSKHDSGVDLSQDQQDLLDKILNDPKVSETPKEIAPQEPIQVNAVHTDVPGNDPIIFTDENGNFFADGQPIAPENVPDDLAGFDPGQELNAPADDTVYDGDEFDDFDFDHEEFDPGQELNAPADDTMYDGDEFDGFDSPEQAPLGEHDPVKIPLGENPIEELTSLLKDTPQGEKTLNILSKYKVDVATSNDEDLANFYPPAPEEDIPPLSTDEASEEEFGGIIDVQHDLKAGDMSAKVVHETTHAEWYHEGLTSDINEVSEQEWVDNNLKEEADAFATEYEFTDASGFTHTKLPEELQDAYEEGYQMGKATYLSEHPDATEAELDAAGKAGAREYLAEYLRDADLWDGGSYGETFQKQWQDAHPDNGEGPSGTN